MKIELTEPGQPIIFPDNHDISSFDRLVMENERRRSNLAYISADLRKEEEELKVEDSDNKFLFNRIPKRLLFISFIFNFCGLILLAISFITYSKQKAFKAGSYFILSLFLLIPGIFSSNHLISIGFIKEKEKREKIIGELPENFD